MKKLVEERAASLDLTLSRFVRLAMKNAKVTHADFRKFKKQIPGGAGNDLNFRIAKQLLNEIETKSVTMKVILQDYMRVACWKWEASERFLRSFQD